MHFFDKIALSTVHFSDERVSHVCYIRALYPPRIVCLLYGYSMVIVWCVRGNKEALPPNGSTDGEVVGVFYSVHFAFYRGEVARAEDIINANAQRTFLIRIT